MKKFLSAIRLYTLINAAMPLLSLILLLNIPVDPKNVWLLGYSQMRLLGASFLFIFAGVIIFIATHFFGPKPQIARRIKQVKNHLSLRWRYGVYLYFSTFLFFLAIMLTGRFIYFPVKTPNIYIVDRILPVVIWLITISITTIILLIIIKPKEGVDNAADVNPTFWVKFTYPIYLRLRILASRAIRAISNIRLEMWVLASFLIAYLQFFVKTIFLNTEYVMSFPQYVPAYRHLGLDTKQFLDFTRFWMETGEYAGNYPPLTLAGFEPLIGLTPNMAFAFFTSLTLLAFLIMTVLIPKLLNKNQQSISFSAMIFPIGLFSYGLLFELERGQFNVIAMAISMAAIYIFHFKPKYRLIAYSLFSISVQLKMWPIFLLLMFVLFGEGLLKNLQRLFGIVLFNFALFFILGSEVFMSFVDTILFYSDNPKSGVWHHSIGSFVQWRAESSSWWEINAEEVELFLLLATLTITATIFYKIFMRRESVFSAPLLFTSSLVACLITTISIDYKLAILSAPFVVYLDRLELPKNSMRRAGYLIIVFMIAYFYSVTQFSYEYKPEILSNNFPAIFAMFLLVAMLEFTKENTLTCPK